MEAVAITYQPLAAAQFGPMWASQTRDRQHPFHHGRFHRVLSRGAVLGFPEHRARELARQPRPVMSRAAEMSMLAFCAAGSGARGVSTRIFRSALNVADTGRRSIVVGPLEGELTCWNNSGMNAGMGRPERATSRALAGAGAEPK